MQILILSNFRPGNASVIQDFLFSFNAYSRHRYYYVFDCIRLEDDFDFSRFDVIVMFWSLVEIDLSDSVQRRVRAARALKVGFLQDEYRDVLLRNELMRQLGVNVVFTCAAERDHATFYNPSRIDTLEAVYTVLTGYVPDYLEGLPPPDGRPRPLDVSYRSRMPPFQHGDLGREKLTIAERFTDICRAHQLRADISVRESDRIYGKAWVRFLRRSRCVLGTASGASVVDFSSRVREDCDILRVTHPALTYEEVKARVFADLDGKIVIDTVSPRVFESTAMHCTMVNHEGGYGGILEPGRHYISVKRDYSNIADVVERIRDHAYCREIAAAAHRDLIASGRYSYRRFGQEFDERLDRHARPQVQVPAISRLAFYARRQRLGQPFIIPKGSGCLLGPVTTLTAAIGDGLPRTSKSRDSAGWRIARQPVRFLRMVRAGWRTIRTTPALMALLRIYLRTPAARAQTSLFRVAEDLLRIDVVRRMRGGIPPCLPLGVELDFDEPRGILVLKGTAAGGNQPAAVSPLPPDIEAALLAGGIRTIIWGYSPAIARLPRREYRPSVVGLGGGFHKFDALTTVCAHAPEALQPLRAILSGEPSPQERQQAIS